MMSTGEVTEMTTEMMTTGPPELGKTLNNNEWKYVKYLKCNHNTETNAQDISSVSMKHLCSLVEPLLKVKLRLICGRTCLLTNCIFFRM